MTNPRAAITVFHDPGCPWGYSAIPALRTLEWRYGAQLDWRLVLIGLAESAQQYVDRGYTPTTSAQGWIGFRRFGMPFAPTPKPQLSATARACRAVVAARLASPGSEWRVLRALQLANFTTPLLLDDDHQLRAALVDLPAIDADAIIDALDSDAVTTAYEADRAESRAAAGTPGSLQGKTANSDGTERYSAPSVVLVGADGVRLEAAGFQPVEAYDVLVANLDSTLTRRAPAATAREVLDGLADSPHGADATTSEVAAIMATGNDAPDRDRAEHELIFLAGDGLTRRIGVGDGAVWLRA